MSNARDQKALELARTVVIDAYGSSQLLARVQTAILDGMEWVKPKASADTGNADAPAGGSVAGENDPEYIIRTLAALMRQMLRYVPKESQWYRIATNYLRKHDLQGSVLRASPSTPTAVEAVPATGEADRLIERLRNPEWEFRHHSEESVLAEQNADLMLEAATTVSAWKARCAELEAELAEARAEAWRQHDRRQAALADRSSKGDGV